MKNSVLSLQFLFYLSFFCLPGIFILFVGCSRSQAVVGYLGGLTGPFSQIGVDGRKGAQLALDEFNDGGGFRGQKVFMKVMDDLGTREGGLEAVKELKRQGIFLLVGPMTSEAAALLPDFLNPEEFLIISPTASGDLFSKKDDAFFRVVVSNREMAHKLAQNAFRSGKKMLR